MIPKSIHKDRIQENIDLFDFKLTKQEMNDLKALDHQQVLIGNPKNLVLAYTRNEMTDILHNAFDFRTDYQIVSEKNMKKIIKKTKS